MHKKFYASGFIYHLPSQRILLQQSQSTNSPWVLFGIEHTESEQPEEVFKNTLHKLLKVEITSIHPIYSYLNETAKSSHTLLYATTESLQEFPPKDGFTFRWFSFKEVLKIPASEQTKHDIVVGQRVIEAAGRKSRGEHTFQ